MVLEKESDSNTDRKRFDGKLEHEQWTVPLKINQIIQAGLIIAEVIERRNAHTRHVSPRGIKPFYAQPPDLHHPLADELAQLVCSIDFGLSTPSVAEKKLYTLCDHREVTSATGILNWEYHVKYQTSIESEYLPETEILSSFDGQKVDVFHAL